MAGNYPNLFSGKFQSALTNLCFSLLLHCLKNHYIHLPYNVGLPCIYFFLVFFKKPPGDYIPIVARWAFTQAGGRGWRGKFHRTP